MKKKKHTLPKILLCFLFVSFIAVFIAQKTKKPTQKNEAKIPVSSPEQTLKETAVEKTKIIYKCGHEKNESKRIEDKYIGKTKEELKNISPALKLTSFSSDEVCFEKNVNEDCQNHFTIRLMDNKIYIFRTNDENTVYRKREININDLSKDDIKALTEGVRADSELELLEILEAFS